MKLHPIIRGEVVNSPSRFPLLIFVIAALFLIFEYPRLIGRPLYDPQAQPQPIAPRGDLAADEQTTIQLFRQAAPSDDLLTLLENDQVGDMVSVLVQRDGQMETLAVTLQAVQ